MAAVTRLLTFVDIANADNAELDARSRSLTARHEAILADGRRVVLLDDRGWSETQRVTGGRELSEEDRGRFEVDPPDIWRSETVEEMKRTARFVVGPDEPFEGHSQADMEAGHWDTLARILRQHGVNVAAIPGSDPSLGKKHHRVVSHPHQLSPVTMAWTRTVIRPEAAPGVEFPSHRSNDRDLHILKLHSIPTSRGQLTGYPFDADQS
jgi:hypothetical protein